MRLFYSQQIDQPHNTKILMRKTSIILALITIVTFNIHGQYIYEVLEYKPAPGQFINNEPWGHPQSAQSIIGGINGSLSLGAFGGYVIFRFEEPVVNHPDNPFGVDFIIFGNPLHTFSEPGVVSVMKDENRNGIPDGTWYELAGSDYFFSDTEYYYEVTYYNPMAAQDIPWSDNLGNNGYILTNSFHQQPYYPDGELYPHVSQDQYTLTGTMIQGNVDTVQFVQSYRRAFGYADNHLRGSPPHTIPPNPYTAENENAGGDGFDISWAVDENGNYVDLDTIHFVKVHTAVLANAGWMGEISTEITGAVVTQPNPGITGTLDMVVIRDLPKEINSSPYPLEAFAFHKGRVQWEQEILWNTNLEGSYVDQDQMLHATTSGSITLTAYLASNPEISASATTEIKLPVDPVAINETYSKDIIIYPNPASDIMGIQGVSRAHVAVYNPTGEVVMDIREYSSGQNLSVAHLKAGIYFVRITQDRQTITLRWIKSH